MSCGTVEIVQGRKSRLRFSPEIATMLFNNCRARRSRLLLVSNVWVLFNTASGWSWVRLDANRLRRISLEIATRSSARNDE